MHYNVADCIVQNKFIIIILVLLLIKVTPMGNKGCSQVRQTRLALFVWLNICTSHSLCVCVWGGGGGLYKKKKKRKKDVEFCVGGGEQTQTKTTR